MKTWRGKRSVKESLRDEMPQLVDDWFTAGRVALMPGTPWEQIHHFRLLTKRFRYTLEIFKSAYGPGIERRVENLRELQTLLGDMNDLVTTSSLLQSLEGMEEVRARLAQKTDKKKAQLDTLWQRDFDPETRQTNWRRYLTQYACRTVGRNKQPVESPEAVVY